MIQEFKALKASVKNEAILKGAWEVHEQFGQTPDTREGQSMVAIGKEVYMYGG